MKEEKIHSELSRTLADRKARIMELEAALAFISNFSCRTRINALHNTYQYRKMLEHIYAIAEKALKGS